MHAVFRYTLEMLIEEAFDVQSFQVSGGPQWNNDERFDIVAIPPASSKSSKANPPYPQAPPNDEQRQMLQTLLAARSTYRRRATRSSNYRTRRIRTSILGSGASAGAPFQETVSPGPTFPCLSWPPASADIWDIPCWTRPG